ncbi:hypothetical protein CR513_56306, partial [Mucuna pruriens]
MTPLVQYLEDGRVPEDDREAKKMMKEAARYTLVGQCLEGGEAEYVMKEVDEGICGTHIGGRALASKIARAGFTKGHKAPPERLYSITSPWPFCKWGVDILGLFPMAPRQIKFLNIVVDYFTKWVEAEPFATISAERKIICRFGIPAEIVSNNGTQFASQSMAEFYKGLGIKQIFTSVEHPQSNGQAEAANRVILKGLRKRLEEAKGRWAEELPQVLWSYHTTPYSTTNETPFRLTFGTEAVIPVEIGESSVRTTLFEPSENEDELRANLDMLQEVREIAHIREYVSRQECLGCITRG